MTLSCSLCSMKKLLICTNLSNLLFVGVTGFEPATSWSQTRCATGLRYAPSCFHKRLQRYNLFINYARVKKNFVCSQKFCTFAAYYGILYKRCIYEI